MRDMVWKILRGIIACAIVSAVLGPGGWGPVSAQTAITVSVDPSQSIGTSRYAAGISHMDTSLQHANSGAETSAKTVVAQSTSVQNTHILAWGTSNPWPDPTQPGPTNWHSLDYRVQMARDTGGMPMITFAQAPWWMKGELMRDGSTRLIPNAQGEWEPYTYNTSVTDYRGVRYPAGYVSPHPYATRILDSQMSKWLLLVQRTAERYMAAPYNVRHFQIWNELKGYYNPSLIRWDYEIKTGDTAGYQAKHGYTYMYNQVYQRIKQVARNMGIPESEVKVGGPYVFFKTWSDRSAGGFAATEPLLQNKPYGTYDQRDADVIKYWLKNKTGAEFIVWDGGTKNREGTNLVDPYTASEKFRDQILWLRSLDPNQYPGANTLPVSQAEWYAFPYNTSDPRQHNSVKTFAAMHFIRAGGWLTMLWGGEQRPAPDIDPSLYTETDNSGGGQPLPWAASYQALKTHFSAGTVLLKVTQSSNDIGVLASALKTMLVNKTGNTLSVAVNGVGVTLNPYEVKLINTPALGSPVVGPTPTSPPPSGGGGTTATVSDYFQRNVASSWGSAGQGGAYTGTDTNAFGVNGNNGYATVSSNGQQLVAILGDTSLLGVDMRIKVKVSRLATGAQHEIALMARSRPGAGQYRARLALDTNGSVVVGGQKWVESTRTNSNIGQPVVVGGLTYQPNSYLWLRFQVTGTNPTTLRIKTWADGQAEPSAWHYTATDSQSVLQTAGSVGIISRLPDNSTSAPVAFAYDDFTVTAP